MLRMQRLVKLLDGNRGAWPYRNPQSCLDGL